MKVRIGNVDIPEATVKRFIDLQSGLALSMIQVSYSGNIDAKEIGTAIQTNALIPFECDILKTNVLVHGVSHDSRTNKHEYILQERATDVPCGYMLLGTEVGNERAIILPEALKNLAVDTERFRKLPYIRFILAKDIPKEWFTS